MGSEEWRFRPSKTTCWHTGELLLLWLRLDNIWIRICIFQRQGLDPATPNILVCPKSNDPFYVVTYFMKWVTTSWTDVRIKCYTWLNNIKKIRIRTLPSFASCRKSSQLNSFRALILILKLMAVYPFITPAIMVNLRSSNISALR